MVVFTPHGMSLMFSFIFGDVHGLVLFGFYYCVWLLLSWASLVFTIIVLLNSLGVHGCAFLNSISVHGRALLRFVGVHGHYSNLILLVFLIMFS